VSGTQEICAGNFTETNQFEKCFAVSAKNLDTAAAVARLSNGVLILTVPKTF
jgi:HSP20 family molecular chaperone IbpA